MPLENGQQNVTENTFDSEVNHDIGKTKPYPKKRTGRRENRRKVTKESEAAASTSRPRGQQDGENPNPVTSPRYEIDSILDNLSNHALWILFDLARHWNRTTGTIPSS